MRVADTAGLIKALSKLPSGTEFAPEVPQMQPTYSGGRPPAPDATKFTIKTWNVRARALSAHAPARVRVPRVGDARVGGSCPCRDLALACGWVLRLWLEGEACVKSRGSHTRTHAHTHTHM
jgi:hypothetical protein